MAFARFGTHSGRETRETSPGPLARGAIVVFLVAVSLFVAALFALVFYTVDKMTAAIGRFGSVTDYTTLSPDGEWSLVLRLHDQGGLGGSTTVFLRPAPGGDEDDEWTLRDGGWAPELQVSWLDARTVDVDGRWRMPFIQSSIDTGSVRTSGSNVDPLGYVHNWIAGGVRICLLSGVSLLLPADLSGHLRTQGAREALLSRQELSFIRRGWQTRVDRYSFLVVAGGEQAPEWQAIKVGVLLGRSADGQVEARWVREGGYVAVLTSLPGRLPGLIIVRDVYDTAEAARRGVEEAWEHFTIDGTALPWTEGLLARE